MCEVSSLSSIAHVAGTPLLNGLFDGGAKGYNGHDPVKRFVQESPQQPRDTAGSEFDDRVFAGRGRVGSPVQRRHKVPFLFVCRPTRVVEAHAVQQISSGKQ